MTRPRLRAAVLVAIGTLLSAAALTGCVTTSEQVPPPQASPASPTSTDPAPQTPQQTTKPTRTTSPPVGTGPGVLPYAAAGAGQLSGPAGQARPLVYVPNQQAGTVQVIDPATYTVTATYPVARSPEHVVPSRDLTTLTAIDPGTGKITSALPVHDPYNLYFSPDGTAALVMAERLKRIDIRDPTTMALRRSLPVPCSGVNHADVTADLGAQDGSYRRLRAALRCLGSGLPGNLPLCLAVFCGGRVWLSAWSPCEGTSKV